MPLILAPDANGSKADCSVEAKGSPVVRIPIASWTSTAFPVRLVPLLMAKSKIISFARLAGHQQLKAGAGAETRRERDRFSIVLFPGSRCSLERPNAPLAPAEADGEMGAIPSLNIFRAPQPAAASSDIYLMHTLVLADDHSVVRQSLKKLLTQEPDLHLVGESDNGLEVLRLVEQFQPDVLVTDLMMPGLNGLEVIRRVRLACPDIRIVAVSVNSDDPYVEGAFTCGADAYVLKASCGKHLVCAVRAALGGERYISPPLAGSNTD